MRNDVNWFAVLEHHAARTPDKPITVFEGETTTYRQMMTSAAALAGGLGARGVGPGGVVGVLSHNCPEFLETIFAANFLGAAAMPINTNPRAARTKAALRKAASRPKRMTLGVRRAGAAALARRPWRRPPPFDR